MFTVHKDSISKELEMSEHVIPKDKDYNKHREQKNFPLKVLIYL
jgi:hypothetical protein